MIFARAVAALAVASTATAHFAYCPKDDGEIGAQGVRIANMATAQNLTAPFIVVHNKEIKLLDIGKPASAQLKSFAETGATAGLEALVKSQNVAGYVCGYFIGETPIAPGTREYFDVPIEIKPNCTCGDAVVTVFTKIELANDAVAALYNVVLPVAPLTALAAAHGNYLPYHVPAYDVGTQANTEKCVDFDSDPCTAYDITLKTPLLEASTGAELTGEGFIHVSNGIRGVGDIDADVYDWGNPIAIVELQQRLPKGLKADDLPIIVPETDYSSYSTKSVSAATSVRTASISIQYYATALVMLLLGVAM